MARKVCKFRAIQDAVVVKAYIQNISAENGYITFEIPFDHVLNFCALRSQHVVAL
jgi:hypothetical protein